MMQVLLRCAWMTVVLQASLPVLAQTSPLAVVVDALPVSEMLVHAAPAGEELAVVVVPPSRPEWVPVAQDLRVAVKKALAGHRKVKSLSVPEAGKVLAQASDQEQVDPHLDAGASRVVVVRFFPGDTPDGPPKLLFTVYGEAGEEISSVPSVSVVVRRQKPVEAGMERIFKSDGDEDATAKNKRAHDDAEADDPPGAPAPKVPAAPSPAPVAPPPLAPAPSAPVATPPVEAAPSPAPVAPALDDDEEPTPAPKRSKKSKRGLVGNFESRALSLRIIPANQSESGKPEYELERGGQPLDEDALEQLGLLEVDPVVGTAAVAGGPSPYLWLLSLPALLACPAAGALCGCVLGVGVPAVVGAVIGVFAGCWAGCYAGGASVVNAVLYAVLYAALFGVLIGFYATVWFGWLSLPASVFGALAGLVGGGVGVGGAAAWNFSRPSGKPVSSHPYVQTVQQENAKLLQELGLDPSRVDSKYFPANG